MINISKIKSAKEIKAILGIKNHATFKRMIENEMNDIDWTQEGVMCRPQKKNRNYASFYPNQQRAIFKKFGIKFIEQ